MNARPTNLLTHFGPLFLTALVGWTLFGLMNGGTVALVPGIIVATALAYAGTLIALRWQTVQAPRVSSPSVHPPRTFVAVAKPRNVTALPARSPRDAVDIAAGD